jgi:hypothetical protein
MFSGIWRFGRKEEKEEEQEREEVKKNQIQKVS